MSAASPQECSRRATQCTPPAVKVLPQTFNLGPALHASLHATLFLLGTVLATLELKYPRAFSVTDV
eukprot:4423442-Amphidinium_carterae.1